MTSIYLILLPFFTFLPWIALMTVVHLFFIVPKNIYYLILLTSIVIISIISTILMLFAYRSKYINIHQTEKQKQLSKSDIKIILSSGEYKRKVIPKAIIHTIAPIVFIFSMICTLIEFFPGWITPFSNTLGYMFVKYPIMNIFAKYSNKFTNEDDLSLFITKLYNDDICMFINLFIEEHDPIQNRDSVFNKLLGIFQNDKQTTFSQEDKLKLLKLVNIKHFVGKIIWYLFASVITFYVIVTHFFVFKL
jgi:hypothetical protein